MKLEQCDRVFMDKGISGKRFDRPEYLRMLDIARSGDVIVVYRLDRLGRSLKELIDTMSDLSKREIELRSIKELIDTSTPTGKLMFHVIAALAEFERDLISERTLAGLEAARARGRLGGRPPITKTITQEQIDLARELWQAKNKTVAEIMRLTGIKSRGTFYNYVKVESEKTEKRRKKREG